MEEHGVKEVDVLPRLYDVITEVFHQPSYCTQLHYTRPTNLDFDSTDKDIEHFTTPIRYESN